MWTDEIRQAIYIIYYRTDDKAKALLSRNTEQEAIKDAKRYYGPDWEKKKSDLVIVRFDRSSIRPVAAIDTNAENVGA